MDIVASPKDDHKSPVDTSSHPSSVWFLLGVIAGCVAAVFLVSHLNAQKIQSRKKTINKNRVPSSGSPVESLDEEKNA